MNKGSGASIAVVPHDTRRIIRKQVMDAPLRLRGSGQGAAVLVGINQIRDPMPPDPRKRFR